MSLRQQVESQANQIELVLWSHGIQARVFGGTISPRLIRFRAALPADKRPEQVMRLQETIAHRLGVSVRISTDGGNLIIEATRAQRYDVALSSVACDPGELCALLGVDLHDGRQLFLHLPSPDITHVLVAGMTGSGKTELIRSMVATLARYNSPQDVLFYIIDPLGRWFNDLAFLPHLALSSITSDLDDATDVVGLLVGQMEKRAPSGELSPRLVLVIDELTDLIMTTPTLEAITRLTQRGRGAGIHIIAGTQKPTADAIGSLVKGNFPTRLVGRVANSDDAKTASGAKGTGAESLLGRGDFLLCPGAQRFQAPLLDDGFLRDLFLACRKYGNQSGPLTDLRAYTKDRLQVVQGGRNQDTSDAQRILEKPGWIDRWWNGSSLGYGSQSAIGEAIKEDNAGAGRKRILRVARQITQILSSSTTSTTSTGDS